MKKLLLIVAVIIIVVVVFVIIKPRVSAPILVKETITKQTEKGINIITSIAQLPKTKIDKTKLDSIEGSVFFESAKPKNKIYIITKSSEVVALSNDKYANAVGILYNRDAIILYGKQKGNVDYKGNKIKNFFVEYYELLGKNIAKYQSRPDSINIELPTGEVIVANSLRASSVINIPDGVEVVLNVKVISETEVIGITKNTQLVLEAENGKRFLPSNAPYINTLRGIEGKSVTIKGITISKTSFKDYPAIYITDILEVK